MTSSRYAQNHSLHGIMYFHRITDNRMSGSGLKSLKFFQQLAGNEALKNCVVVTNMWNAVKSDVGESREAELKEKDIFFKPAIDHGTEIMRHNNSKESASAILRHMINNTPIPLEIQVELVKNKKHVFETVAGQTLLGEIAAQEQKHQKELDELRKELEQARRDHDQEAEQEIQESAERLNQDQARLVNERSRLLGQVESGPRDTQQERHRRWWSVFLQKFKFKRSHIAGTH